MIELIPPPESIIIVGEDGHISMQDQRITDPIIGRQILTHLKLNPSGYYTVSYQNFIYNVEVFDQPLIVKDLRIENNEFLFLSTYDFQFQMKKNSLSLDDWDRIHGETTEGIPFVLSKKAQSILFNLADDFEDDFIVLNNKKILTPPYFKSTDPIELETYWSQIYRESPNPGWNLGEPAPAFAEMTPKLKLPKSRILVLGSGEGHDAAFFAREGHIVTAIDFSPVAISKAKKLYGHIPHLNFLEMDIFKIDHNFNESFDLIIEHTCYCAIEPNQRNQLTALWKRLLAPKGLLMGVFFVMPKRSGPPFGGSEWELRERLKKSFRFLFWGRWKTSPPSRKNIELFVLAQKL